MNSIRYFALFVFLCGLFATGLHAQTTLVSFTVSGKVSIPESAGIAGVVVSDGYQVKIGRASCRERV